MYFWGHYVFTVANESVQDSNRPALKFPVRVPGAAEAIAAAKGVASVACGGKHMVIVCKDGSVLGLGSNHFHQLGFSLPQAVLALRPVRLPPGCGNTARQVACGTRHTLILLANGDVLASGDNAYGQLGCKPPARGAPTNEFSRVAVSNVAFIATAHNSSFAVDRQGRLYSWGNPEFGHLGHGNKGYNEITNKTDNVLLPTRVEWFVQKRVAIVDVAVGREHLVVRSDKEAVYACGQGAFGRLGNGDVDEQLIPVRVEFPERKVPETLKAIAAGDGQTLALRHSPAVGSVVYAWGFVRGGDGELRPTAIITSDLVGIASIAAGRQNAGFAVRDDGRLLFWGKGGKFANGGFAVPRSSQFERLSEPLEHLFVTSVAAGATFAVAFCDDARCRGPPSGIAATWAPPPGVPEAFANLQVVVPYNRRVTHIGSDTHDEGVGAFIRQVFEGAGGSQLSGLNAEEYVAAMPCADKTVLDRRRLEPERKKGAHALQVGDKVRLWMTDVYALGVVVDPESIVAAVPAAKKKEEEMVEAGEDEGKPAGRRIGVEWARDDWVPEVVELFSDDETLDDNNDNRWQALWFLGKPGEDEDES